MFFEVPADRLLEVYVTEDFAERHRERLSAISYETVSDSVCHHLSDTKTPQGVMALVKKQEMTMDALLYIEKNPCFFLLENLQDPGNMGTILRTAEGTGVTGIIMNRYCVDPYSPKVVRSTMGSIFREPFVIVDDFQETLAALKKAGIRTYAAHLTGENVYQQDYRGGTAFFIGNEGNGLSEDMTSAAEVRIRIPMKGRVESLNAATAATVLMYEVMRQRMRMDD